MQVRARASGVERLAREGASGATDLHSISHDRIQCVKVDAASLQSRPDLAPALLVVKVVHRQLREACLDRLCCRHPRLVVCDGDDEVSHGGRGAARRHAVREHGLHGIEQLRL